MKLPSSDDEYLACLNLGHEVVVENGMTCVVLKSWPLPPGFNCVTADLLLRLHAGYPDIAPDMWWFSPAVRLADGTELTRTNVHENYLGRTWQRWSRHLSGEQWRAGTDGIENYVALIRHELERSVPARVT